MRQLFVLILVWLPYLASASPLVNFKATFDVDAFGFTIGSAKQKLNCKPSDKKNRQVQTCTLTNIAKPPGWVERFINESVIETIVLEQSEQALEWVSYQKELTRRYDDRTEHKTITFKKDTVLNQIIFVEKEKTWPLQTDTKQYVYDEISIVYAIQHAVLNKNPLTNFYIQGNKEQQKLSIYIDKQNEIIDLPFDDYLNTTLIRFKNANIDAKVWLLNDYQFFPGRIEIENKKTDKTITLELDTLTQ